MRHILLEEGSLGNGSFPQPPAPPLCEAGRPRPPCGCPPPGLSCSGAQAGEKPCPLHPECLQSGSNHTMEITLKLLIAHFLPPIFFF